MATAQILGKRLEYRWIGPPPEEAATIVFLHEALGSVSTWRDFPDRLAAATGCGGLVYSREGHGGSEPASVPESLRYLHEEALEVFPAVLDRFSIRDAILFGHSDGASMALILAGGGPKAARGAIAGMIVEAPHVFVEDVTVAGVRRMRESYETTNLRTKLQRHHGANTDTVFRAWADAWLSPEFRSWNIEELLPGITCPLLVVQGEKDQYGTLRQVEATVSQVSGPVRSLVLPGCGHSPHAELPEDILKASAEFIRETLGGPLSPRAAS